MQNKKTRTTFALVWKPNQTTMTGMTATNGVAYSAFTYGSTACSITARRPIRTPSGIPRTMARTSPSDSTTTLLFR